MSSAEDAAIAAAAAAIAEATGTAAAQPPAPTATPDPAPGPTPAAVAPSSALKPGLAPAVTEGGAKEPEVTLGPTKGGGAMMTVTQDLDSDKLRMAWAKTGGALAAFEGNLGMILLYKDMSKEAGVGSYMNGVGFSAGLKVAILTLEPPSYEKRDTSWTAWRLGVGGDMGVTNVTINTPKQCFTYLGRTTCTGGQTTATMASQTLTMNIGFMQAFGSFDGPSDWSGFAVGFDWAPSSQKTTTTVNVAGAKPTTESSFNARGFAINFESGSLATLASKMGKKAKMKMSIFFLPPVDKMPFFMSTTFGAVWY